MSSIYERFVKAAQSGRSVMSFNEMAEKIEKALRSGEASAYLHPVDSEAAGFDLVARLKAENVAAFMVNVNSCLHVKVSFAQFYDAA